MDNIHEISLLLDFYGGILTPRQYEMLDLHYNNDYSLGEIAECLNISRQGVYDNIRRGKRALCNMEKKLGLVKKFMDQKRIAEGILESIRDISSSELDEVNRQKLSRVEEGILSMMDL